MRRSPARSRKVQKRRVRLAGSRGRPVGVVKTRPLSLQAGPAVSRFLSCCCLCSLRGQRHSVGSAIRRSDARVLVGRWVRPPVRVRWSERRMVAVPALRSRSSQWRPRSSPLRRPVRRASSYRAWSRSARAASRNWRASAAASGRKRLGRRPRAHPPPAPPRLRPLGATRRRPGPHRLSALGTAVREVKEETGLDIEITGLVGTYTDPKHISGSGTSWNTARSHTWAERPDGSS